MKRGRGLVALSLAASICAAIIVLSRPAEDPCLVEGRAPTLMHAQNLNIFSCEDKVYLPARRSRSGFKRIDGMRASEITVLPFKYMLHSGRLYYVAVNKVGYGEDDYSLQPIEGIDLGSLEILEEQELRDKDRVYAVLSDHVMSEPRADRESK